MTTKVEEICDSEAGRAAPASRRTRDRISPLLAAAVVFQLLSAVAACGQEAPPRSDLPASLWFGMSSAVVRQRLEEQGAKLGKPKESDDKFSGGKFAKAEGLLILDRKVKSGSAWFLRDSLVGLELSFSVGQDYTMGAWVDSVRAALERKYGPPVHSDLMAGCSLCMGNSGEREAVWSISDSEIRLTIKASIESLLKPQRLPGSVHLSYGIPPFRKGVVPITHGP